MGAFSVAHDACRPGGLTVTRRASAPSCIGGFSRERPHQRRRSACDQTRAPGSMDSLKAAVAVSASSWRGAADEGGRESRVRTVQSGQGESYDSRKSFKKMYLLSMVRPSFPRRFPLSRRESKGPSEPSANRPASRLAHSSAAVQRQQLVQPHAAATCGVKGCVRIDEPLRGWRCLVSVRFFSAGTVFSSRAIGGSESRGRAVVTATAVAGVPSAHA